MPEERGIEELIIEAGFRTLAKKMHPDVEGGSHDAMVQLTASRDWLLQVIPQIRGLQGQTISIQVASQPPAAPPPGFGLFSYLDSIFAQLAQEHTANPRKKRRRKP